MKTEKKEKVKKTPSIYTLFFKHRRKELLSISPQLSFGELSVLISKEWKTLSVEQKQVFATEHAQESSNVVVVTPILSDDKSHDGTPPVEPTINPNAVGSHLWSFLDTEDIHTDENFQMEDTCSHRMSHEHRDVKKDESHLFPMICLSFHETFHPVATTNESVTLFQELARRRALLWTLPKKSKDSGDPQQQKKKGKPTVKPSQPGKKKNSQPVKDEPKRSRSSSVCSSSSSSVSISSSFCGEDDDDDSLGEDDNELDIAADLGVLPDDDDDENDDVPSHLHNSRDNMTIVKTNGDTINNDIDDDDHTQVSDASSDLYSSIDDQDDDSDEESDDDESDVSMWSSHMDADGGLPFDSHI